MISLVIANADIRKFGPRGWVVGHPTNDAVLAYCDTEAEARRVRDAINNIAHVLREGGKVKP